MTVHAIQGAFKLVVILPVFLTYTGNLVSWAGDLVPEGSKSDRKSIHGFPVLVLIFKPVLVQMQIFNQIRNILNLLPL